MNNRIGIVLMCALITQEASVFAGPTMSRVAQDLMDQCDTLNDKEKMMIIASSMVVTAIGSVVYQNSMIESAAQIDRDDQFELELEQAALESVVNTEDYAHDLADLDFQRYSELSDDSMPRLERVCDDGTVVDDTLAEQAISDVIAWSQKPIVKPTGSNRNIPPVRSLDQY